MMRKLCNISNLLETVSVESIASYVVQSLLGTGDNNRLQVILQK